MDQLIPIEAINAELARRGAGAPQAQSGVLDAIEAELQRRGVMPRQARGGVMDTLGYGPSQATKPPEARTGDFLKPIFGGHNPVAETYDVVAPMLKPDSDRTLPDRAADAASFAINAPVRMATQGQYGINDVVEGVTGGALNAQGLARGEQSFVENNPAIIKGLGALGEIAPGMTRGMGQGAPRMPQVRGPEALGPERPNLTVPIDRTGRARQAAQDMEDLQIRQHGPAIAQAARGGEGVGALAKTVESLPIVGRPLQKATQDFVATAGQAGERIAGGYAPSGNIQRAGATVREYFDNFKNERSVPRDAIENMDDAALHQMASEPPRNLGSLKSAADARYEQSWRLIPDWMRNGGSRNENVRLMGDMPNTRQVIMDISGRNLNMVNELRLGRRTNVADETGTELPTRFREGSIQKAVLPLSGGLVGRAIQDIAGGNWRGSLQTMRNLRSAIRRIDSRAPDKEGNTLHKADMSRLQQAIHRDMNVLLERIIADADSKQERAMSVAFRRAQAGFQSADAFYRRYSEAMEGVQRITKATRDEAAIQNILQASQNGPKGDLNMIVQVRRMAPDPVMDDIASSLITEMGRPTGAAGGALQESGFSATRFATSWNNMHPAARRAIFGHRPELANSLDKLARVTQHSSDLEKLANHSRSGQHSLIGGAILAGPAAIAQNFMTGLAGAVGMYGVAQFMASPFYVNWLTRTTGLQLAISQGGGSGARAVRAMAKHTASLLKAVKADKALDPDVAKAIAIAVGQMQGGEAR